MVEGMRAASVLEVNDPTLEQRKSSKIVDYKSCAPTRAADTPGEMPVCRYDMAQATQVYDKCSTDYHVRTRFLLECQFS